MKKTMTLSLISLLFLCCKKDNVDSMAPVIALTSPSNNQVFLAGQTVDITGMITDNEEIHAVHLYVNNKATDAEILHLEDHVDNSMYMLSKSFTAQAGVTYVIKVEADDHSSNQSEVNIQVSAK